MTTPHIVHWEEAPRHRVGSGPFDAYWTALGAAAGSVTTGLRRQEIQPGRRGTPAHTHSAEEEFYVVLAGAGLCWLGGETFAVGAGDCLLCVADGPPHSLIAGPDGLDVLVFGTRAKAEVGWLPRAGVAWLGSTWADVGAGEHPWAREAAAGDLEVGEPGPRPASVVAIDDVPAVATGKGRSSFAQRKIGDALGSRQTGLRHFAIAPHSYAFPPHIHSAEEEIFVVLGGAGVCELGDDEEPVRRGHIVARPAGSGVAHAFRAGAEGLELLAYGERRPYDVTYYPRSRKLSFGDLGVMMLVEPVGYWDGEE
jgi:uncharacterized cupin superfamily protein